MIFRILAATSVSLVLGMTCGALWKKHFREEDGCAPNLNLRAMPCRIFCCEKALPIEGGADGQEQRRRRRFRLPAMFGFNVFNNDNALRREDEHALVPGNHGGDNVYDYDHDDS